MSKLSAVLILVFGLLFFQACEDSNGTDPQPETDKAKVRVIHTSYDAPAVDILLNDAEAIADLAYGESSGYATIDAGTANVKVTAANSPSTVVINADLTFEKDKEYTIFAVGALANIEAVVQEDSRNANAAKAKVRVLHGSPDAPAVDVKLGSGLGAAIVAGAAFKDLTGYLEVDEGDYSFAITPANSTTEVEVYAPVGVSNGSIYTVVAHGTLDDTDAFPFAIRVFVDNGNGDAFVDLTAGNSDVLVTHASPDAPGVGLLVDDVLVNTSAPLNFPDNTGYLSVDAGIRNIKVNAFGTSTTVINADVAFEANKDYTVFAIDVLDSIEALVIEDNLTAPTAGNAHVRFVHLSPDAPAVDIAVASNGAVVFADYEYKESSAFTPLAAGTYDLDVRLTGTSTSVLPLSGIALEDGKIYTVFANGFVTPPTANDPALNASIIINN